MQTEIPLNTRKPKHSTAALISLASLWVFCVSGPAFGQGQEAVVAFECSVTPAEDLIPSIGVMVGHDPVWIINDGHDQWRGPDQLVKTAWVVARDHPGDSLVVTGRRLDGEGKASFQAGVGAPLGAELIFTDVDSVLMVPGGADRETIDTYAFRGSYIVYPSPGCWELTARLGEAEVRIVLEFVA